MKTWKQWLMPSPNGLIRSTRSDYTVNIRARNNFTAVTVTGSIQVQQLEITVTFSTAVNCTW